jgi:hypothetical protein
MQFKCNAIGVGPAFVQKTLKVQRGHAFHARNIMFAMKQYKTVFSIVIINPIQQSNQFKK